jgi:hypothetical protein
MASENPLEKSEAARPPTTGRTCVNSHDFRLRFGRIKWCPLWCRETAKGARIGAVPGSAQRPFTVAKRIKTYPTVIWASEGGHAQEMEKAPSNSGLFGEVCANSSAFFSVGESAEGTGVEPATGCPASDFESATDYAQVRYPQELRKDVLLKVPAVVPRCFRLERRA